MRNATLGKKIALVLQALVLALGFGVASLSVVATPVSAADCSADQLNLENGANCGKPTNARENLFAPNGIFSTIANTLIFLVGAVAVIYLIIGGLRYVISNGDSKAVESAKNTILYAIIGIVVAVIAFALVQFVISSLNKTT